MLARARGEKNRKAGCGENGGIGGRIGGVTKGFTCNTPQGRRRHVNVHVHADSQYLRKVIQFRNNSHCIARAARMKVTNKFCLHIRAHKT